MVPENWHARHYLFDTILSISASEYPPGSGLGVWQGTPGQPLTPRGTRQKRVAESAYLNAKYSDCPISVAFPFEYSLRPTFCTTCAAFKLGRVIQRTSKPSNHTNQMKSLILVAIFAIFANAVAAAPATGCFVSGCSSQVCSSKFTDEEYTFCLWIPENACYSSKSVAAKCGLVTEEDRQAWTTSGLTQVSTNSSDACGWIYTQKLAECIKSKDSGQSGTGTPSGTGSSSGPFDIDSPADSTLPSPPSPSQAAAIKSSAVGKLFVSSLLVLVSLL